MVDMQRRIIRFVWIFTAVLTVSCKPRLSYSVLSFFFDGVPVPEAETEVKKTVQGDSVEQLVLFDSPIRAYRASSVTTVELTQHPDYQKKACEKCHEIDHSYRLKDRQPQLCYQCHTPFESKYNKLHGPVAAGFCLACHEPHTSKSKALAKLPLRQICLHCHDAGDMNKNEAHQKANAGNCIQCHDAHGGDTSDFLKKERPQ